MFRKITLLALILLSISTTFVACSSSDDATEQNQNYFRVNPPKWLHGKWTDAENTDYEAYFIFSENNIQDEVWNWKELYQYCININTNGHVIKTYDVKSTDTYYEVDRIDFEVRDNLKIEKISDNSIKITYSEYFHDGETYIDEWVYNKEK